MSAHLQPLLVVVFFFGLSTPSQHHKPRFVICTGTFIGHAADFSAPVILKTPSTPAAFPSRLKICSAHRSHNNSLIKFLPFLSTTFVWPLDFYCDTATRKLGVPNAAAISSRCSQTQSKSQVMQRCFILS